MEAHGTHPSELRSTNEAFLKQVVVAEENARKPSGKQQLPPAMLQQLSPFQQTMLDKVHEIHTTPITTNPSGTNRPAAQVERSISIHKRINPGYVDLPWTTSASDFKYQPPPDFTSDYLNRPSDAKFQHYMDEAIRKHVDLKKTAH